MAEPSSARKGERAAEPWGVRGSTRDGRLIARLERLVVMRVVATEKDPMQPRGIGKQPRRFLRAGVSVHALVQVMESQAMPAGKLLRNRQAPGVRATRVLNEHWHAEFKRNAREIQRAPP